MGISKPLRILSLVVFGFAGSLSWAGTPSPTTTKTIVPYAPVTVTAHTFSDPRPLRVWVIGMDLRCADLDFAVTPKARLEKFETMSATTLEFAQEEGVQVAINATPFSPIRAKSGEGVDVVGLNIRDGEVISPAAENKGVLVIDARHEPRILAPPIKPEMLRDVVYGVGGFTIVLANGKNLYETERESPKPVIHPRTAVGLTADRKNMAFLIVDGRQKGISEGVTLYELAELGKQAGCDTVLNLDGGGSTTLVVQDPVKREWQVMNTPVGLGNKAGTLRPNGNNLGLRVFVPGHDLTAAQLRAIMPHLPDDRLRTFIGPLNRTMAKYRIDTPSRRAAFLGQLAHESGELRFMEDIASGEAYEGRKDLGNTQPGDGKRYKGRGPIQLTGRFNYRNAGEALRLDLEARPELAAQPVNGCLIAGWFWDTRKLNDLADKKDYLAITKRINGGTHGQEQREKYYKKALEILATN